MNCTPFNPRALSCSRKSRQLPWLSRWAYSTANTLRFLRFCGEGFQGVERTHGRHIKYVILRHSRRITYGLNVTGVERWTRSLPRVALQAGKIEAAPKLIDGIAPAPRGVERRLALHGCDGNGAFVDTHERTETLTVFFYGLSRIDVVFRRYFPQIHIVSPQLLMFSDETINR